MNFQKALALTIIFLSGLSITYAEEKVLLKYEEPENKREALIEKQIRSSGVVDEIVVFINDQFQLQKTLTFKFGGLEGPLYDSGSNEILVPYTFIEEVKHRFSDANYSETGVSIDDATWDSVMHTLLHELAHALIFTFNLPVVGKEEDAADSLATILLIEYFDDGTEIAISAADLFDLESENSVEIEEEDFWDEHSLDAQRFYSTACLVLASDPEKYTHLKIDVGFSEERAQLCIDEYESLLNGWIMLLQPHIKHNK